MVDGAKLPIRSSCEVVSTKPPIQSIGEDCEEKRSLSEKGSDSKRELIDISALYRSRSETDRDIPVHLGGASYKYKVDQNAFPSLD